ALISQLTRHPAGLDGHPAADSGQCFLEDLGFHGRALVPWPGLSAAGLLGHPPGGHPPGGRPPVLAGPAASPRHRATAGRPAGRDALSNPR
ncbi:MAG: hypothetical protein ACR2FU_16370, partial [Streptosporangiaceae bacterium]